MSPEGASRTTEAARLANCEINLTTIPPPSEYPTIEKHEGPVQANGEEARTNNMTVEKNVDD